MYDRILVPTDGSDHGYLAAEHAMKVAKQFDSIVHALFVVKQAGSSGHWDFAVEKQEAIGEEALDAVVALGNERGVNVERHLRRGTPSTEIVAAGTDYDAHRDGHTGPDRLLTNRLRRKHNGTRGQTDRYSNTRGRRCGRRDE